MKRFLILLALFAMPALAIAQATGNLTSNGIRTDTSGRQQVVGSGDPSATPIPTQAAVTTPADATSNTSIPGQQSFGMLFNGTSWDRARSLSTLTDGNNGTGLGAYAEWLSANPTNTEFDAAKGLSGAHIMGPGSTVSGVKLVSGQPAWTVAIQSTAANCSASTAAVAVTWHCSTGVTVCIGAVAAQASLFANLRNGATGAGNVLWNGIIAGTAGTNSCITKSFPSPVCGSVNTAMTLELSANTSATVTCATTLEGIDTE